MSIVYFAKEIGKAALLDTKATKVCLPVRVNCSFKDDEFVVNCGEEFNCNPCCDVKDKYYLPVKFGDKIHIQTKFKDFCNPDPRNPLYGYFGCIEVKLIDLATGLESSLLNINPIGYTGWNGVNSYQVLEFTVGGDIPNCFKLVFQVVTNNSDPENPIITEYCSQHYKIVDDCEPTFIFENRHKGFDCEGNWYGLPLVSAVDLPFLYSNKIRLKAEVRNAAPTRETTSRNGLTVKKTIKYIKEYNIYYIPLYVIKYINNKLDQGDRMIIDGKYFNIEVSEVEQVNDCFYNIKILVINECKEKC